MLSTETSQRDGVSRNLNSSITNSRSDDSQEEDVIQCCRIRTRCYLHMTERKDKVCEVLDEWT